MAAISNVAMQIATPLTQEAVLRSSGFTGRRVALSAPKAAHPAGCSCSAHSNKVVRASASNAEGATSQSAAQFASVSQSTAPPPASAGASLPALLAAGALGGAAVAFIGGGSSAPAPAPAAAPVAEPANGAPVAAAKRAAPAAIATMAAAFPNSMQEESFVKALAAELRNLGFRRDNCIALVNTCRDEVCRPLVMLIDREFGLTFNISGLGGLVNCGKTGFKAAFSHSPEFPCDVDGKPRERYIFFGFPHVSVGESGEVGSLLRRGRGKPSSACGALIAIKNDITKGNAPDTDDDDLEYSLLRQKVYSKIPKTSSPSLVQVTKAALQAITDDIESLVAQTVDPATADYAVITGVQIHSGNQIPGEPFRIERTCDYIAPNAMYAVIRGQKKILHCEINQITEIKSVPAEAFAS